MTTFHADPVPGQPPPPDSVRATGLDASRSDLRRTSQRHHPRIHRDMGVGLGRGRDHILERPHRQRVRPPEGPVHRRHDLVPHLVEHPSAPAGRPHRGRSRRRVGQGRLLRQERRLQLFGVVHAACRTRRSAREAGAPARRAARRGPVRSGAQEADPVPAPGDRADHRPEVRRREGRPPQRRAALAAGPVPRCLRIGAGRPVRPRNHRCPQGARCRPRPST